MKPAHYFFAVKQDLREILQKVEEQLELKYVSSGLFESPEIIPRLSLLDIDTLGIASAGDWILCSRYVIMSRDTEIGIRAIEQRRGGMLYNISLMENPSAMVIQLGGLYGENTLIPCSIGTANSNEKAEELYKLFVRSMRRVCKTRIGKFYIGKYAEVLYNENYRFTQSTQSPPEYDIKKHEPASEK